MCHSPSRRPSRALPRAGAWAILLLLSSCLGGCATRDAASSIHPHRGAAFQECSVDLSAYRSVQLRTGGQDPTIALAVALSGGGHRATNFSLGVLTALEALRKGPADQPNALSEADYLSTVSGGGLAAGAYVATLHDHLYFGGAARDYSLRRALAPADRQPRTITQQRTDPDLRAHLRREHVNDLIHGAFSLVSLGTLHRGDFLEHVLDDRVLAHQWRRRKLRSPGGSRKLRGASLVLADVFVPAGASAAPVRLPYWVANATVYENGAIFPWTPDHLRLYEIVGYRHRLAVLKHDPARESYDAFLGNVPLAAGMMASGNFPVAIPATTLDSTMDRRNPHLHLLDGGMADNLGVITALRLLRQENPAVRRKVLIVVDAYNGNFAPFSEQAGAPVMLTTAFRTTMAYLDSWRGRYREVVRALCTSPDFGGGIEPIFLSFDDLADLKDFEPLRRFGLRDEHVKALRATDPAGRNATPFQFVRRVPTWYGISAAEQEFLFAVGRYVVARQARRIRDALGWPPPAPAPPAAGTQPTGSPRR